MKPGKGAQIARSAGTSARVVAKEGTLNNLEAAVSEMRKILSSAVQQSGLSQIKKTT